MSTCVSDPCLGLPFPGLVLFLALALKVRWCFGITTGSESSGPSHNGSPRHNLRARARRPAVLTPGVGQTNELPER